MPMVGWPANGTSASEVKMSMWRSVEGEAGSCRKTISERLNSEAMDCFCCWVSESLASAGTEMMATGFPV